MSYVYLLSSGTKTYVGATIDPDRRLRQHNRELSGGAKATSGGKWDRVLYISGILNWRSALQLEWAWKHRTRVMKLKGVLGRIQALTVLLDSEKCSKKSLPFSSWPEIFLHISPRQTVVMEKIESWCTSRAGGGSQLQVSISSNILPSFPSVTMSSKTATSVPSAELAALVKAIEALTAQQVTNNKLVTAVLDRLSGAAPAAAAGAGSSADAEVPVKGKRGRKPKAEKEPKVKAAPPAAADGVIRIGSASEGDNKEFGNFYKAPFVVDGKEYISLANYFNSMKFATTDADFAEDIRTQKNPALTRAKASSVKDHTPRADWDTARLSIMKEGLRAKFAAHPALREKLLATGDSTIESTIEEEMRLKGFWSIGEDGSGTNHMGRLLMEVRDELRGAPTTAAVPKAKKAAAPAAPAAPAKKPAAPAKALPPPADSDDEDSSDEE